MKENEIEITFLGHSSTVIRGQNTCIYTDPVFSQNLFFIRRRRDIPLSLNSLPDPHIILISHAHFDHLDFSTLQRFRGKIFFVPCEAYSFVRKKIQGEIYPLKWWEEKSFEGIKITSVPARHHGVRSLLHLHLGYCGYVIEIGGKCIYFAGDTAYFEGFKIIGEKFKIDVALLPVGAYRPRFQMKYFHTSPQEAVIAFKDLKAKFMIPIHWGVFKLGLDGVDEPAEVLRKIIRSSNLDSSIRILKLGERFIFPSEKI